MPTTLGNGNISLSDGTQSNYSGYPSYTNKINISLNTWYQASEKLYVTIRASGSYMNNLSVFLGTSTGSYTRLVEIGDDWNTNTKGQFAAFPVDTGGYFYVQSPGDNFASGYAFETALVYGWKCGIY